MALHSDDARGLLQKYLRVLTPKGNHKDPLCTRKFGTRQAFLPRQTWINANVGFASASERVQLRAFMEIVSRLSVSADFQWQRHYRSFWKQVVMDPLECSICNTSVGGNVDCTEYDRRDQLMKSEGPKFLLNFKLTQESRNQLEMLREFMIKDARAVLTRKQEQTPDKQVARGGETKNGHPERRIELGLSLSSNKLALSSGRRTLAKLLDDIGKHERNKSLEDGNAVRYEISTLWMPVTKPLLPIDIDILINILTSESSTIRHLHLGNTLIMLTVAKRLQVFQQLLRAAVCSLPDTDPQLQALHLERVPLVHKHLSSICSALRYPNSLRALHMEWQLGGGVACAPAGGNTRLMWAWIAFGIFHPNSEAKLDRLNLTGLPLSSADLMAFQEVLRNPHAGRYLWLLEHKSLPQGAGYNETPLPDDQRVFVKLMADTKLCMIPKAGAQALEFVALDTEEYEAVITLAAWVCVVVPGCGFAWVSTASIVSRREEPSKCISSAKFQYDGHPRAGANVRVFERAKGRFTDSYLDIRGLLYSIGHCLEEFHYMAHNTKLSNSDLLSTLEACPNLTHLNLKGAELTGILALRDRFEMQQCQLKSLNVSSAANETQILSQLAVVLSRRSATSLRNVTVSGAVDPADVWEELAGALRTNQTLEYLHIDAAKPEHRGVLARLQSEFAKSTLSLRARVAFVSAIQTHAKRGPPAVGHTVGSSSAMRRFDAIIVAQIFAFAGKQRTLFW